MRPRLLIFFAAIIYMAAAPATASTLWNWRYFGSGVDASGTITTLDSPDASGGFLITAITGTRNGETITALQPAGSSIPGNEPFHVDNLVFLGPGLQLTGDGFGFSTSTGAAANPFFADFLPVPGYLEFASRPASGGGLDTFEVPVQFVATPVPEPSAYLLVAGGLVGFVLQRRRG